MALMLAILALALTLVCCVLTWRARRAALHLALEMIELRDRLAALEQAGIEAAESAALTRSDDRGPDATLLPRVLALEAQLRDALAGRTAPGRDPSDDPRVHVRTQLKHRGFHSISILGAAGDGRFLVEAERGGIVTKGHAEIAPDGTVHWASLSSLRAFP
jgi:hypothetical protein